MYTATIKFKAESVNTIKAMDEIIVGGGFSSEPIHEGGTWVKHVYQINCNSVQEFAELFIEVGSLMQTLKQRR